MALMLGELYEALRAGNVPDDKARAAAEEVANYEGEISNLLIALVLGVFALQWQILLLLRLPS